MNHTMKTCVALVLLIFILAAPATLAALADSVRVAQGLLSGTPGKNPEVRVYRDIPFAAPPVGELRWKPPQPPASWQGVRQATEPSNGCWQTPYPEGSIYHGKLPSLGEDCLYLNIWTAAKSAAERRPVMVWIHGGGFTRGFGGSATYDGEILARKGVVVVTINYRLGIFGFFSHAELTAESAHHASGNYGVLDQIAALQWVRKNIAAFGGDPARVTIFGESAGSWAVNALMASPLARGLFQRAIGESGANFSPMKSLAEAEQDGATLASTLGATQDVLKSLRAKPAEEIVKALGEQSARVVVDGWILPQDIYTIFAQGRQNDVPLIVGSNADEGTALVPQAVTLKAVTFISGARLRYGTLADQFLKIYPAGSDAEAVSSFYSAYRDEVFGWEMRTWARMATKTGHQPAYLYYFTRIPPGPQSGRLRAFHASDLAYVFGNFTWPFPWDDTDRKLSESIITYWVNFAATGNPNGDALPKWPAYDAQTDQAIELGDHIAVLSHINKPGLDVIDSYFQSVRANSHTSPAK